MGLGWGGVGQAEVGKCALNFQAAVMASLLNVCRYIAILVYDVLMSYRNIDRY